MKDLGSLSNVGVRAQREQNPRPEGTEVSEPEGDSFECLDCVVATLGMQNIKEVIHMLNWLANLLYRYGVINAGAPSFHGAFEAKVPDSLRRCAK